MAEDSSYGRDSSRPACLVEQPTGRDESRPYESLSPARMQTHWGMFHFFAQGEVMNQDGGKLASLLPLLFLEEPAAWLVGA